MTDYNSFFYGVTVGRLLQRGGRVDVEQSGIVSVPRNDLPGNAGSYDENSFLAGLAVGRMCWSPPLLTDIVEFKLDYSMWFALSPVVSKYSPNLVNRYGAYLQLDNNEKPVYRVAWYLDTSSDPYRRKPYISFRGFASASYKIVYVPFVSMDSEIIADGTTTTQIQTYTLSAYASGGRRYYSYSNAINVNLKDADGNELTDFVIGSSSEHCQIFETMQECIAFVTGGDG